MNKLSILKSLKSYFERTLIDYDLASDDMKATIAKSMEEKLNKAREIFNAEELTEILMLFTKSEQGKKKLSYGEHAYSFDKAEKITIKVYKTKFINCPVINWKLENSLTKSISERVVKILY